MVARIGRRRPYQLFIREWMDARRLDNKKIAERMECGESTVSKLLNKKMVMTTDWLARFADALDVDSIDLYRHPDTPTQDDLIGRLSEPEREQFINMLRKLTGTNS